MKIEVCFMEEIDQDLTSTIIEIAMGTDYSHVAIRYTDENDGIEKLFHSITKGVCIEESDPYYNTHRDVKVFEVELSCTFEDFNQLTIEWLDIKYGYLQFFNCLADKIGFGDIDFSGNELKKMICSELVARILHKWSKFKFDEDMDSVDPKDVERVLTEGSKNEFT